MSNPRTPLILVATSVLSLSLALELIAHAQGPRRIGIIASVGETSAKPEVIKQMMREGTEWFRFNLAHKDRKLAGREAGVVRAASRELGREVPLLFDLPGGKIRTGPAPVESAVTLEVGAPFTLLYEVRAVPSTREQATVDHPQLGRYTEVGSRILLHQGKIELAVTALAPGEIRTRVVRGGVLRGRATVNVTGQDPPFPLMTQQDRRKLKIAVASGATHVGVSMVQNERQMRAVRRALDRLNAHEVKLVSKIETLSALENLEAIVDASDVVMIARGDLATAVGTKEALRAAEEKIAEVCHRKGKTLIDATGFEGTDAEAEVRRARSLGPSFIMLKGTAIEPDPVQLVSRLHELLKH